MGQHLPAGAGVSLLRKLFYFPDASSGSEIAILAVYAGAGLMVLLAVSFVRGRRRVRAAAAGGEVRRSASATRAGA